MLQVAEKIETDSLQNELVARLSSTLAGYLDQKQVNDCIRAYEYAAKAHFGQYRKSGEAYICHPIAVATSLAEIRMDANCIMAAILHDVIEDTGVSKAEIAATFNPEVSELVDAVTKLTKIDSKSQAEAQAENVRKMFLAMGKDLRVIMIKLADRLHNMQTLGAMPREKKRRIAKETLDIYAPIANRLGMNRIKHSLEALSFQAMYPRRYSVLDKALKKAGGSFRKLIETIERNLKNRISQANISCEISGREKNLYSIYQKMLSKKVSLSDIFDVYAFRIFCDSVDDCYRILGIIHNIYKPIPGKFKDYIGLPKTNGYQSLHTVLIGPHGYPIEIQIRTHEMHRMAESGIAAHWLYKSDDDKFNKFQDRANEWLRDLLEIQQSARDSLEFIDNLKIDLFPQEVFVFTPKGKIIKMPRGATIIDFAYAVHTDIGNACVSARVDRKLVPLQTKLENGVTVEVITAIWARPNPLWLNYVTTAKARSGIRNYLKNFKQQEAIDLGRRLLEKELQAIDLSLELIDESKLRALLKSADQKHINELLEDIGLGNKMPFLIAARLRQDDVNSAIKIEANEHMPKTPLILKGTEGMVVTLAKCCRPIPGDAIVGFFNPGKGIVVHHSECKKSRDVRKKQTDWLDVEWSTETAGEFPVDLRLEVLNQRGSLATVASAISELNSNIENVTVVEQDTKVCVDLITISVKDRVHLANVMRRLKEVAMVNKITRVKA